VVKPFLHGFGWSSVFLDVFVSDPTTAHVRYRAPMRVLVEAIGESDCEAIGGGWLAQPVNALSSLAYTVVGLILVPWAMRSEGDERGIRLLIVAASIATGIGSLMFHGPQGPGSRISHDVTFLALLFTLAIADLGAGLGWRSSTLWTVLVLALGGTVIVVSTTPGITNLLTAGVAIAAIAGDVVLHRHRRRRQPWHGLALGTILIAVLMFVIGRTNFSWCSPDSWLQAHAAWHMLGAIAIGFYAVATGSARSEASP
jgi:hypothetical protein